MCAAARLLQRLAAAPNRNQRTVLQVIVATVRTWCSFTARQWLARALPRNPRAGSAAQAPGRHRLAERVGARARVRAAAETPAAGAPAAAEAAWAAKVWVLAWARTCPCCLHGTKFRISVCHTRSSAQQPNLQSVDVEVSTMITINAQRIIVIHMRQLSACRLGAQSNCMCIGHWVRLWERTAPSQELLDEGRHAAALNHQACTRMRRLIMHLPSGHASTRMIAPERDCCAGCAQQNSSWSAHHAGKRPRRSCIGAGACISSW